MLIPIIATAIRLLYLLVEFPYLRRNRIRTKQNWDAPAFISIYDTRLTPEHCWRIWGSDWPSLIGLVWRSVLTFFAGGDVSYARRGTALAVVFGAEYSSYRKTSKRLIPGVY